MKKIDKDQIALIVMTVTIFLACIGIKIYSGSLYKGTYTYEPVTERATEKSSQTEKNNDSKLWLMVAATAKHDESYEEPVEETYEAITETTTQTQTQYKVVENIEEIVVPYDVKEDAQIQRMAAPVVEKPEETVKEETTVAPKSGTFVAKRLTYDAKGNIIYKVSAKEEKVHEDVIIKANATSPVTVAILADGIISLETGYALEEDVAGLRKENVITKILVPSQKISKTTETETKAELETETETKSETETETKPETETETETKTETETETTSLENVSSETESLEIQQTYVLYELTPVCEEVVVDGWYAEKGNRYYYYNEDAFAVGFVNIGGFRYYFDETGKLCSKTGVDVSVYQGNIDWAKVKAAGVDFAIVRAGVRGYQYAKLTKDTMFETNVSGALSAGLEVGAYVFSQATTEEEAVEEASLIITMCQKYNITGPLIIDVEEVASSVARQNKISIDKRTDIINVFASMVRNAGYTPMLYTGESWLATSIDASKLNNVGIWIAKWSDKTPNCNFTIWQYDPKGKISGISTDVDVNLWITK